MGRWIGKYFKDIEFTCPCGRCDPVGVHPALVETLDKMRGAVGVPLRITSGVRCLEHNFSVGSRAGKRSLHVPRRGADDQMLGYAADVQFASAALRAPMHIMRLYYEAERFGGAGIGLYPSWIHVDRRDQVPRHKKRGRWVHKMFGWPPLFN